MPASSRRGAWLMFSRPGIDGAAFTARLSISLGRYVRIEPRFVGERRVDDDAAVLALAAAGATTLSAVRDHRRFRRRRLTGLGLTGPPAFGLAMRVFTPIRSRIVLSFTRPGCCEIDREAGGLLAGFVAVVRAALAIGDDEVGHVGVRAPCVSCLCSSSRSSMLTSIFGVPSGCSWLRRYRA